MIDRESAAKIAAVLAGVDGECHHCAFEAAREMMRVVPGHDWIELVREAGDWTLRMAEAYRARVDERRNEEGYLVEGEPEDWQR